MRILFLCSCLKSGRDGVGDYTLRIAEELMRLGHQPAIIAVHDRHISRIDKIGDTNIPLLRFPANLPWRHRITAASRSIEEFNPDWISLQFVPYGFDERGISWMLGRNLRRIVRDRRLHVMFHELWIGAHCGAPLKDRLIGFVQRRCIIGMIDEIGPDVVTTSNEPYIRLLEGAGVSATRLPLFGNIPLAKDADRDWLEKEMRSANLPSWNQNRGTFWIFALFGTLHPIWSPEPLLSYLAKAAELAGRRVIIASIGRLGPGESLWQRISSEYSGAFQFIHLGEQTADRVSEFLSAADFGIAASPWELVEKSGTVATMVEHGLPVIVNRDDVRFAGGERTNSSDLLIKMDADLPKKLLSIEKASPRSMLPEVADLMLNYLGVGNAAVV